MPLRAYTDEDPVPRPGVAGFADGMRIFPRLMEWESQIALRALREGTGVNALRQVTPFRQYLSIARRAALAGEPSPFAAFTSLFGASESVDMLVSYGNFRTVYTWTWTLARRYPRLNLPLDDFLQDALYTIVPNQARSYDPEMGTRFSTYVIGMLMKRFRDFVAHEVREQTAPVISREGQRPPRAWSAVQTGARTEIASLQEVCSDGLTLLQQMAMTVYAPENTPEIDDSDAWQKIHLLSRLAGLSSRQEETLIGLFVYGGSARLISQMRESTVRAVRSQRQLALESLRGLGVDTVEGVLSGRYATVEDARARMPSASEAETPTYGLFL
jgi:RNA polymerase sigma factor (sigma-70 family)